MNWLEYRDIAFFSFSSIVLLNLKTFLFVFVTYLALWSGITVYSLPSPVCGQKSMHSLFLLGKIRIACLLMKYATETRMITRPYLSPQVIKNISLLSISNRSDLHAWLIVNKGRLIFRFSLIRWHSMQQLFRKWPHNKSWFYNIAWQRFYISNREIAFSSEFPFTSFKVSSSKKEYLGHLREEKIWKVTPGMRREIRSPLYSLRPPGQQCLWKTSIHTFSPTWLLENIFFSNLLYIPELKRTAILMSPRPFPPFLEVSRAVTIWRVSEFWGNTRQTICTGCTKYKDSFQIQIILRPTQRM